MRATIMVDHHPPQTPRAGTALRAPPVPEPVASTPVPQASENSIAIKTQEAVLFTRRNGCLPHSRFGARCVVLFLRLRSTEGGHCYG